MIANVIAGTPDRAPQHTQQQHFTPYCNIQTHHQMVINTKLRGHIELICGPMFSGKSTELLRRMRRYEIAGHNILKIKYAEDVRYSVDSISTHDR
jgi:hypothetical protein